MTWIDARTDKVRHRIGQCPACRAYVWADLTLVTEVTEPEVNADGKASVIAIPHIRASTVTHRCDKRTPAAQSESAPAPESKDAADE